MWERSLEAAASARLNFDHGYYNRALSSAYYAVFYAARASLRFLNPDLDSNKTHAGVIRRFGLEVVVRKGLDPALGRLLTDLEDLRLTADYEDEGATREDAADALKSMDVFLTAIAAFIGKDKPNSHS